MKNINKVIIYTIIGVLILIVTVIGVSFAFFTVTTDTDRTNISGDTGNTELKLTVTAKSSGLNNLLIPQPSSTIDVAVVGTNGESCVDGAGNTVCQVYEIIIENTGDIPTSVNGILNFDADTMENLKWGLGSSSISGFSADKTYSKTETDLIGPGVEGLQDLTLEANDNVSKSGNDTAIFYIVVYIEETNTNQAESNTGKFTGTITFETAGKNKISANFGS
jgi:hypothetical protein